MGLLHLFASRMPSFTDHRGTASAPWTAGRGLTIKFFYLHCPLLGEAGANRSQPTRASYLPAEACPCWPPASVSFSLSIGQDHNFLKGFLIFFINRRFQMTMNSVSSSIKPTAIPVGFQNLPWDTGTGPGTVLAVLVLLISPNTLTVCMP